MGFCAVNDPPPTPLRLRRTLPKRRTGRQNPPGNRSENVLAKPTSNPDEIKNALVTQLTSTVRWRETLLFLTENKVQEIIDAGPGKTIVNMARKLKDIEKTSLLDM